MPFYIKIVLSIIIIVLATQLGRYFPSLSGLIATMPLTGSLVLIWLYADNPGNFGLMESYTRGALWGILPSILFFLTVYQCFRNELPLSITLSAGFGVWLVGAFVHQLFIK
ncbi:MAG: hypothetical protein CVU87_05930 [Firmicutes bacterium HGW-Firmicutes-12]|jgi:uncharacterized membrane protein (GlpM family)|nr:MAG: hypothetical protein CVU87_05930 [Firmicutes bacterium HGW-Firmicutes-12]